MTAKEKIRAEDLDRIVETNRWPKQMARITDTLLAIAREQLRGLDDDKIRRLAALQMAAVARVYGGTMFYVPKDERLRKAIRDLRIWCEHDGTVDGPNGIRSLARRHRIATYYVWEILRRQRVLHQESAPKMRAGTANR